MIDTNTNKRGRLWYLSIFGAGSCWMLDIDMAIVYIGIGSNIGDRIVNIQQALDILKKSRQVDIISVSSFYETEPEGYEDQDWFLNAAAGVKTDLLPNELLDLLKGIEQALCRKESIRWGPRVIDLDILLYDQLCVESPKLTIPHPRMHERKFVLEPLAEIGVDVVHPVLKETIKTLLSKLVTQKIVKKM
jgi:2-amino-4-hydroxy-6-hydroxymethyldihydropteridine diphosphokinase